MLSVSFYEKVLAVIAAVPAQSVWISGSVVEHLGNAASDVDVFVAVEDRAAASVLPLTKINGNFDILISFVEGRRVDYEFWSQDEILRIAARLHAIPLNDAGKNILNQLSGSDTDFVHRLKTGWPVMDKARFNEIQSWFDFNFYKDYLVANTILYVDDAFDDTVGMFDNKDIDCAALRARFTVEMSVDVLLYSNGITNDKAKYRIKKLKTLGESNDFAKDVYNRFWQLQSKIPGSLKGKIAYIQDALKFSSEIIESVQH
ncbi:hypothetical protein ACTJJ0_32665 [Chitinophaga sp. 22321]|uniref:Nucleotidyltransferase domain-containing protein n=1 Tax=Chitinophaga hostae TaxID=2831022 RepID=A0ABS5J9K5_9BACT|nr:hypothetical protein [Chitinophaga hostae]MBS0031791.1 hypothetical protein [Chitinophaga hostae]